jgi:tetratricopeptide (TPR) repeat protein
VKIAAAFAGWIWQDRRAFSTLSPSGAARRLPRRGAAPLTLLRQLGHFAPSAIAASKVVAMQTLTRSPRLLRSLRSLLPARAVLTAALALAVAAPLAMGARAAHAQQDSREAARVHYQAGQKAYAAGDYRLAIREFAAAEQLSPSGFNDYNLGLCYDKLGEADPAVRYYRSYLERVPDAKNRSAVEASVARLEAALSSAASKEQARLEAERRAEEMRQAEAARKAEEERQAAARKAEEDRKAEEARKAAEAAKPEAGKPEAAGADKAPEGPAEEAPDPERKISAAETSTGDQQLDRASAIDIGAIRNQRAALLGAPGSASGRGGVARAEEPPVQDQGGKSSAKSSPFYKKWWFWVIVGVGAYVVVSAATEDDSDAQPGRNGFFPERGLDSGASSGATLLRW